MCVSETLSGLNQNLGKAAQETEPYDPALYRAGCISVTVIFGMADMEMRSQYIQAVKTDGSWHGGFVMDEEQGACLGNAPR